MEQQLPARQSLAIEVIDWPSLLEQIRLAPGLWLGGQSVTALEHYLDGIKRAEEIHNLPAGRCLNGFHWLEFEAWTYADFNYEHMSIRSFQIALNRAGAEEAAFLLWFTWYDQFRRQRGET